MNEESAGATAEPPPIVAVREASSASEGALHAVVAIARESSGADSAAAALVDALAEELGLARARLLLMRPCAGGEQPCLEPVASSGSHASLTRDMPSLPMDGSNDLVRVAASAAPAFHSDVHGLGDKDGDVATTGLGRWRAGVTTQASAVLPLELRGEVLGVLAIEWSTPQAFDEDERANLATIADAAALVLGSFIVPARAEVPSAAAAGCTPAPTASLAVTCDGIVVPAGTPGGWAAAPALRVHVGAAAPNAQADTEEVFWDVVGVRNGLVVLALGLANAPRGGAAEVAETARHMLRASSVQGAGPARGLGLLAAWLSASGPDSAWISALACEIDVRRASASWCAAGTVALVTRYTDGRFDVVGAKYPPLGSSAEPDLTENDILLLPGDRVALACGEIASLAQETPRREVSRALADRTAGGADAALGTLFDVLRTRTCAEGAIVLDVMD